MEKSWKITRGTHATLETLDSKSFRLNRLNYTLYVQKMRFKIQSQLKIGLCESLQHNASI